MGISPRYARRDDTSEGMKHRFELELAMRIGLVYDLLEDHPAPLDAPPDWDAEYEPEETVQALEAAIEELGHTPVRLGTTRELLTRLSAGALGIDAALSIAEGYGTRNREAHAPIVLELAGIPTIGSDALSLSVSLDKHLTKVVAQHAGLATPAWALVRRMEDLEAAPPLPLFVKPRYEGTAKGITASSRCDTVEALYEEAARQLTLYGQDVIVESFIGGAEFTVGVIGHDPPEALPVLQRAVETETGIGLHALEEAEGDSALTYREPIPIEGGVEFALQHAALAIHEALECHDFSRSDFRLDRDGRVQFLEINPLPTFAPDGTFAILAELSGQPYGDFLADMLARGLQRLGLK